MTGPPSVFLPGRLGAGVDRARARPPPRRRRPRPGAAPRPARAGPAGRQGQLLEGLAAGLGRRRASSTKAVPGRRTAPAAAWSASQGWVCRERRPVRSSRPRRAPRSPRRAGGGRPEAWPAAPSPRWPPGLARSACAGTGRWAAVAVGAGALEEGGPVDLAPAGVGPSRARGRGPRARRGPRAGSGSKRAAGRRRRPEAAGAIAVSTASGPSSSEAWPPCLGEGRRSRRRSAPARGRGDPVGGVGAPARR